MIPCNCGGKMYRHQRGFLKRSGEEYQAFLCKSCQKRLTFYRHEGTDWSLENRKVGEWNCDDSEFMAAINRSRSQVRPMGMRQSLGNGESDLHANARSKQKDAELRVVSGG